MEEYKITDRKFWENYWNGFQPYVVKNILFEEIFRLLRYSLALLATECFVSK